MQIFALNQHSWALAQSHIYSFVDHYTRSQITMSLLVQYNFHDFMVVPYVNKPYLHLHWKPTAGRLHYIQSPYSVNSWALYHHS